jgi:hypothetical protein
MRWSKLRQRIESGIAPSLAGRVRFMVTRYRRAHDAEGRWAVLLDGDEIGGLGCIVADQEQTELLSLKAAELDVPLAEARSAADQALCAVAHHTLPMFYGSLSAYLNMSVEAALASSDAVLRSLAILDRRLGRRRLAGIRLSGEASELEVGCLRARLDAEGLEAQQMDAADLASRRGVRSGR